MASAISGDKRAAVELVDLARATPSLVLRRRIQSVWIVLVDLRSPYAIAVAGFMPESRWVC